MSPARQVSAGAGLLQERRQHELDLRLSRRRRAKKLRSCICIRRTPSRAAIRTGDRVRVFNDRGSLLLKANVDGVVQPGVARAPSTRWLKRASDGRNVNVLTSDRLTDMGGGPTFYSCLVQVERCGD